MPSIHCGLCQKFIAADDVVHLCSVENHGFHSACIKSRLNITSMAELPSNQSVSCFACHKRSASTSSLPSSVTPSECAPPSLSNQIASLASVVASISTKLEKLDKLDHVVNDVAAIKEQMTGMDDLRDDGRGCLEKLNSVSTRLDSMESSTTTLSQRVEELEKRPPARASSPDQRLQNRVRQLECERHASDIVISGLPESSAGDRTLVQSLCELLGVPVDDEKIKQLRRMRPSGNTTAPRSLFITFGSSDLRNAIIAAKRLKGPINAKQVHAAFPETQRVNVNEFLPAELHILYMRAKTVAKEKRYRYVWIRDGCVYVRKASDCQAIRITDADQLDSLP